MVRVFTVLALIISFSVAHAKVTEGNPIPEQSQWVLSLLPDGYYVAENVHGALIIIKDGSVVVARALLPDDDTFLSCTRGSVAGNMITGTTITIVNDGGDLYTVIPVSGDTIDVSEYYLAGEQQDDHMPDQYDWESVHVAVDICRDITQPVNTATPVAP